MYELYRQKGVSREDSKLICDVLAKYKEAWVDIMMVEELGLIPDDENPLKNALVTFFSFAFFGLMPLIAFIYGEAAKDANGLFEASTVITGVFLFLLGVIKSRFTYISWVKSGIETLLVGAIAAAASYLVGMAFDSLIEGQGTSSAR